MRQLALYVKEDPTITVAGTIYKWAPPNENNSVAYLSYVVNGLGCSSDTLLSDALQIPAIGKYPDEPA